jgi:hypothetical protein
VRRNIDLKIGDRQFHRAIFAGSMCSAQHFAVLRVPPLRPIMATGQIVQSEICTAHGFRGRSIPFGIIEIRVECPHQSTLMAAQRPHLERNASVRFWLRRHSAHELGSVEKQPIAAGV